LANLSSGKGIAEIETEAKRNTKPAVNERREERKRKRNVTNEPVRGAVAELQEWVLRR
jgi:hypothetical protein